MKARSCLMINTHPCNTKVCRRQSKYYCCRANYSLLRPVHSNTHIIQVIPRHRKFRRASKKKKKTARDPSLPTTAAATFLPHNTENEIMREHPGQCMKPRQSMQNKGLRTTAVTSSQAARLPGRQTETDLSTPCSGSGTLPLRLVTCDDERNEKNSLKFN
ncbi:hypothetical protein, no similarity [Maudiozyma saulgeensis]|uniref:Uncharacterized protein n=1 Tax=Maudiozyma saulgeensis TaxID=1789683 RepID=A0A1X7R3I0_9SACH|nr:hypothetical protein, no similarity [Kazachstania saulgeensis]